MFENSVGKDTFFDRADILAILDKRVSAFKKGYRQNITILGHELVGKTSIVYNFLTHYKDATLLPIYIPLTQGISVRQFALQFIGTLLHSYLSTHAQAAKAQNIDLDMDSLIGKSSVYIPKTVDEIKRLMQTMDGTGQQIDEEVFVKLFGLTSILNVEANILSLLILDEFHLLRYLRLKDPFGVFGKQIMISKSTMFIMVSSKVNLARKILKEELNLLFGNFEILDVGLFDDVTSERFLKHFLSELLTAEQRRFIVWLTQGHPFYLDIIATKIKEHAAALTLSSISMRDIAEVIFSLLFDIKGSLYSYFSLRLGNASANGRDPMSYISIMTAIADGIKRLPDISGRLGRQLKSIQPQINRLAEMGVICKNISFCSISDNLFSFWLKYRYQQNMFTARPFINRKEFIDNIEKVIISFVEESGRGILEQIRWLFQHTQNEPVVIDGRRLHLHRFSSVTTLPSNPDILRLENITADKVWLCAVKENFITEEEMIKFITLIENADKKPDKGIVIALVGMDENARLLAKEKRLLLWGLIDVNMLLDIYGGRKVIKTGYG